MGMDVIELVIAIEESFDVRISDADAQRMKTPRYLIDWLKTKVSMGEGPACLSQRAFHRLRQAILRRSAHSSAPIHPATSIAALFPDDDGNRDWLSIGEEFRMRGRWGPWQPVSCRRWHGIGTWTNSATLGDVARELECYCASRLLDPGEGWSETRIGDVLGELIVRELGLNREQYSHDLRFVEDIGLS